MADTYDVLASPSGTLHMVDIGTRETHCGTPVDDGWTDDVHTKRCFFCFGDAEDDDGHAPLTADDA